MNTVYNANINPDDIAHFDSLASQWWDKQGPMRTLHDINPLRLQYIRGQAGQLTDKLCLDIGCGGGILSEALGKSGGIVTGIDMATQAIQAAKGHTGEQEINIDYQCTNAEQWAKKHPHAYDVITCCELLEHVPHPESLIKAAKALCKPGGMIVFSTINRSLWSYASMIALGEYVLEQIPRNTHQYGQFITPSELAKACRETKLEVIDIQGMSYNPLTHKAWLGSSTLGNYFLTAKSVESP